MERTFQSDSLANRFSDVEIKSIAKFVEERLFQARSKRRFSVFLCGADIKNSDTGRSRMADLFSEFTRYEIHYPEDLFEDLLAGQGNSLLSLENLLADSVDVIVIFPESAGSLVELGAFANNERLVKKLICLPEKKYRNKKSFINYGPHRLIRSSKTGKVIPINYDDLSLNPHKFSIYYEVDQAIRKIVKSNPVQTGVANILEAEGFVLSIIFIADNVSNVELYKLLKAAAGHDDRLCEIAVRSALGRLIKKRLIIRTAAGYLITATGAEQIRNTFKRSVLDSARSELMNKMTRRHSSVMYDRMLSGARP